MSTSNKTEHDLSDEPACIHFDFWLNDIEADRLFQCINHDISHNCQLILERRVALAGDELSEENIEADPYVLAYIGSINALKRLKTLLKNKREDKPESL